MQIETYERSAEHHHVLVRDPNTGLAVDERHPMCMAQICNGGAMYARAYGRSVAEAVGNLILSHPRLFNISIWAGPKETVGS